jgi:putative PIN family toxin of toxin-antitoxin system
MSVDRVLADTNVVLSGVVYRGNEARVLDLALLGHIRLVLAEAVIDEVRRVLKRRFPQDAHEFEDFLNRADYELVRCPDPADIDHVSAMVRDPDDAPILASILLAKPDLALTGDKDLLTDEVRAIAPVCRCAEYLMKRQ